MIISIIAALLICGFVFIIGYGCGINRTIEVLKRQIHSDFIEK